MAELPRQDLPSLLTAARCLLDDQREALRQANFTRLLATTSALQRLMDQIARCAAQPGTSDWEAEIQELRRRIAGHQRILGAALAATPSVRHPGAHSGTPPASSLLLDHHA